MEYNKLTKIAVIGVSHDPQKYGHRVFRDLVLNGYTVEGVNPKGGQVEGKDLFTSLPELDEKPELLILVVPPTVGIHILEKAKEIGIMNVWLQPGAESQELVEFAQQNNINLTYDNCFMTDQGIW